MSTVNGAQSPEQQANDNSDQQVWDAAKFEAALVHLERLQEQVDALRLTVPSIVAPLSQRGQDKAQLFANIKTAAVGAVDSVQALRQDWTSEQTQEIFSVTRASLEKDGDLSKASEVPRYGWTEEKTNG